METVNFVCDKCTSTDVQTNRYIMQCNSIDKLKQIIDSNYKTKVIFDVRCNNCYVNLRRDFERSKKNIILVNSRGVRYYTIYNSHYSREYGCHDILSPFNNVHHICNTNNYLDNKSYSLILEDDFINSIREKGIIRIRNNVLTEYVLYLEQQILKKNLVLQKLSCDHECTYYILNNHTYTKAALKNEM
jgi:hypothetical protein